MHHIRCEFWTDQYERECTCGATAKRAPWFDKVEKDYAELSAANSRQIGIGEASSLIEATVEK